MPLDPALLVAWIAACLLLCATPGPDFLFVIGQTLRGGPRLGWAAAWGIWAGAVTHVALSAAGVAALVAASPTLFGALRVAGALYLLWIGIGALRDAWRGAPALVPDVGPAASRRAAFLQGFLTNLLNPKVILFFLAILPQFVAPDRASPAVQMLLLGPFLPLLSVPFFWAIIAGAGRLTTRLSAAGHAARWLNGAAGAIFLGLGARLLTAR